MNRKDGNLNGPERFVFLFLHKERISRISHAESQADDSEKQMHILSGNGIIQSIKYAHR